MSTARSRDLVRMAFAEGGPSLTSLAQAARLPIPQTLHVLNELQLLGEITVVRGHHHGDFDFCACDRPDRARLTHWYNDGPEARR